MVIAALEIASTQIEGYIRIESCICQVLFTFCVLSATLGAWSFFQSATAGRPRVRGLSCREAYMATANPTQMIPGPTNPARQPNQLTSADSTAKVRPSPSGWAVLQMP